MLNYLLPALLLEREDELPDDDELLDEDPIDDDPIEEEPLDIDEPPLLYPELLEELELLLMPLPLLVLRLTPPPLLLKLL